MHGTSTALFLVFLVSFWCLFESGACRVDTAVYAYWKTKLIEKKKLMFFHMFLSIHLRKISLIFGFSVSFN